MKKENILRKNWQFQNVMNDKNQIVTKYLVVYYLKNGSDTTKIGISIPKKYTNAVLRNQNKRQLKSLIDKFSDVFFEKFKGMDLVIIARKPFTEAAYVKKIDVIKELIEHKGV